MCMKEKGRVIQMKTTKKREKYILALVFSLYRNYDVGVFSLICFGSGQGILIGRVHFDCLVSLERIVFSQPSFICSKPPAFRSAWLAFLRVVHLGWVTLNTHLVIVY